MDAQAGHEKTLTFLLPALAGCNLIYGMGMLELGMTLSFAQMVIDDEIAAMVKRVVRGIRVNDGTLAVDLIKKVGPARDFLAEKHTREHQREEVSKVKLIDRRMRGGWEKRGSKDLAHAGSERAKELLATHKPLPLPPEVATQLRAIVEKVQAELADEAELAKDSAETSPAEMSAVGDQRRSNEQG